eukprot:4145724-Ditylum_brightwellii.AAC.1
MSVYFITLPTKQEINSIDFTFDATLPSGAVFELQYDRSVVINRLSDRYKHIAPLYPSESLLTMHKLDKRPQSFTY